MFYFQELKELAEKNKTIILIHIGMYSQDSIYSLISLEKRRIFLPKSVRCPTVQPDGRPVHYGAIQSNEVRIR